MGKKVDEMPPHPDDRVWLKHHVPDDRPKAQIVGTGTRERLRVEIGNLTESEYEVVQGLVNGTQYIRFVDGRLWSYDVNESLPTPQQDPIMFPHWRDPGGEPIRLSGPTSGWHSPSLILSHLLSPDPRRDMELLESYGFDCMRSRRSRCGGYWEQWVLHGTWSATGELKKVLTDWNALAETKQLGVEVRWRQEAELACRFIVDQRIRFGTLDISIQRWALSNPE